MLTDALTRIAGWWLTYSYRIVSVSAKYAKCHKYLCLLRATENARSVKCRTMKITDQIAGTGKCMGQVTFQVAIYK